MSVVHVDFVSRRSVLESSGLVSSAPATVSLKPKRERSKPKTVAGFRWQPLKQRFVQRNVYFCPETQEAYSYGWWRMVERIGPYLVANTYRYSVTTSRHQSDVFGYSYWRDEQGDWGLLSALDLKVDLFIEAPNGLQDLSSAERHYEQKIADLEAAIAKKGSRKAKNAERRKEISSLQVKLASVKTLQAIRDAQDRKAAP